MHCRVQFPRSSPELPAPQVSEAQADRDPRDALRAGARARQSLGSNQDKNFLVVRRRRRTRRRAEDRQSGVQRHRTGGPGRGGRRDRRRRADAARGGAAAEPRRQKCTAITDLLDGTAYVRLLRYLPGGTLVESRLSVAGRGRRHGRAGRPGQPGARRLPPSRPGPRAAMGSAVRPRRRGATVSHVADPSQRERVEATAARGVGADRTAGRRTPAAGRASRPDRRQRRRVRVAGASTRTGSSTSATCPTRWAVSELAITLSSVLGHSGHDPTSILPGVRAFHAIRPLSAAEVDAVWPLLVLRTAVLIVSGAQQVVLDPDNEYLTDQSDDESRMFEQATSVSDGRDDRGDPRRAGPVTARRHGRGGPDPARRRPRVGADAGPVGHLRRLRRRTRRRRGTDVGRTRWPARRSPTVRRSWSPGSGRST